MKSTEVYREVRVVLAPWCKEMGFRRTSGGMLGWYRPVGDEYIVFWLQCDRHGWDDHAGSRFVVEFQRSVTNEIGGPSITRHRLSHFLKPSEFQTIQEMQNSIIASLPKPPKKHHLYGLGETVANQYRQKFTPDVESYTNQTDIWLRYFTPEHVREWAEFLKSILPRIVSEMEGSSS